MCVLREGGLLFFVCRSAFTPPRTDSLVGWPIRCLYDFFISFFLAHLKWSVRTILVHVPSFLSLAGCHLTRRRRSEIPSGFEDKIEDEVSFRHSFVGSDSFRSQAGRNGEDSYVGSLVM